MNDRQQPQAKPVAVTFTASSCIDGLQEVIGWIANNADGVAEINVLRMKARRNVSSDNRLSIKVARPPSDGTVQDSVVMVVANRGGTYQRLAINLQDVKYKRKVISALKQSEWAKIPGRKPAE